MDVIHVQVHLEDQETEQQRQEVVLVVAGEMEGGALELEKVVPQPLGRQHSLLIEMEEETEEMEPKLNILIMGLGKVELRDQEMEETRTQEMEEGKGIMEEDDHQRNKTQEVVAVLTVFSRHVLMLVLVPMQVFLGNVLLVAPKDVQNNN